MSKKKPTNVNPNVMGTYSGSRRSASEVRHPAVVSAESDLLKLTREFEELRTQLEANDVAVEALGEEEREDNKQLRLRGVIRQGKIDHLRRQRRVFETHFINVKELLSNATRTENCDQASCLDTLMRHRA